MCRTIFARVVAGMRHCKQLRPLPLTSYKFLNTETPNRLVCQHLLSRFRFCHPSSKTEYKYEAFSLHNISRGFVSEATDMVDIVSDPKFSHSSQSRELVPHKTRKEVSPVEDPEDIIPSHEPGSSPVMFRIVERPRGLDEKESGKRPAGFVPHGVLRTPRKMQPSRRFQPRVVDKDGNRILDIGGFLSHAISLLPKEKPVKTVLAGEKVSPSVLNEVLQNLRRRKYFSRVKEVSGQSTRCTDVLYCECQLPSSATTVIPPIQVTCIGSANVEIHVHCVFDRFCEFMIDLYMALTQRDFLSKLLLLLLVNYALDTRYWSMS